MNELRKMLARPAMPLCRSVPSGNVVIRFFDISESEHGAAANSLDTVFDPSKSRPLPLRWLLPLTLAGFFASCAHTHIGEPVVSRPEAGNKASPLPFTIERDLVYTPDDWPTRQVGDLYLPDREASGDLRPAVLLIHGGGWSEPERRFQMASIAEKLAARGYVVFNTTYRLSPTWTWPAAVNDLRQALRWMVSESGERGIDPDRLATFGYSAGGHLAALLGLDPGPDQPEVKAIVAGGAPSDLTLYEGGALVPQFMGGSREEKPDAYRLASPVNHVDAGDPPVFLYHAANDHLVPPVHAESLYTALAEAGVPRELFWMEGRNHVTGFLFEGESEAAAIAFLDRVLSVR